MTTKRLDELMRDLQNPKNYPDELLIPRYLLHSVLYYQFDTNIIQDHEYDALARRIYDNWDKLEHMHKRCIDRNGLLSGGHYIEYPNMVLSAGKTLLTQLRALE
jgi:hypothetical protein